MSCETTNIAETLAEKAGKTAARAQELAESAGCQVRERAGKAVELGQEGIRESPFAAVLTAFIVGIALGAAFRQACLWNRES